MSASDTESSCDWTIINNEGSDVETVDSGSAVEHGVEVLVRPLAVDPEPHYIPSSSGAGCDDKPLDDPQTIDETLAVSDAGDVALGKDHVTLLSASDHSDIVSLGDMKHDEEAAAGDVLYLGSSSSSQYTFTPAERVFPAELLTATNSSSEDDAAGGAGTVIRRRRLRKNTKSITTQSGEESGLSEEEEEEEEEEEKLQAKVQHPAPPQSQSSGVLNKCILLSLVVAVGMGLDHFYNGIVQSQGKQKTLEKDRVHELLGVRDLIQRRIKDQQFQLDGLEDLEKQEIISLLSDVMKRITAENRMLHYKEAHIQAQKDNLEVLLQESAKERRNTESWGKRLTFENQLLKSSLNREEKSVSTLQEEIRSLRSKFKDLEDVGSGANSLRLENQRLKEKQQKQKLMYHSQRDDLMAEAQMLRKKVDQEMKVTDTLREELSQLRAGEGEQNSRLMELETKLTFEQQRSDMWERLYLETQQGRAKGDTEPKVKNTKKGFSRKVKETFDAVKNSTKEFVHHHKEQIKKAKEAVKKNLRKFSDSVKSTIRHFKDSASTFINKARGFYRRRPHEKDNRFWRDRAQETHHRHTQESDESFQSNRNTRKSGGRFQGERGPNTQRANTNKNDCAGVFACSYLDSTNLFHKATEPIRADEFHLLLQRYIQQEVDRFHHWEELEMFVDKFFHNGVFIHDQMLFTDFVRDVKDYLVHNHSDHGFDISVLDDLDDYVYRHFYGNAYSQSYRPSGPFERPQIDPKEELRMKQQQRKQRARPQPHSHCKWSRSDRNAGRHMVDAKIELGPLPFDPKY